MESFNPNSWGSLAGPEKVQPQNVERELVTERGAGGLGHYDYGQDDMPTMAAQTATVTVESCERPLSAMVAERAMQAGSVAVHHG